jgi:folate-binding protein YgfZ
MAAVICCYVIFLSFLIQSYSFVYSWKPSINFKSVTLYTIKNELNDDNYESVKKFGFDQPVNIPPYDSVEYNEDSMNKLPEPTITDMKQFTYILANITDNLEKGKPESALSTVSQQIGWLLSHNIPGLVNMLLKEYPVLRNDEGMMKGYLFIIEFLTAISNETKIRTKKHQNSLKILLETAKNGIDGMITEKIAEIYNDISTNEFLVYLDSEIDNQSPNSKGENLLVTLKLLLIEEIGKKKLGIDTVILSKLASEQDISILEQKTIEYFKDYDINMLELFVSNINIMKNELNLRYQNTENELLSQNLSQIESIIEQIIVRHNKKSNLMIETSSALLRITGKGSKALLQGLTTAYFELSQAGDVLNCCFLSSKGELQFYCRAIILEKDVLLLCDPKQSDRLLQHISKYIFPMDMVQIVKEEQYKVYSCFLTKGNVGNILDNLKLKGYNITAYNQNIYNNYQTSSYIATKSNKQVYITSNGFYSTFPSNFEQFNSSNITNYRYEIARSLHTGFNLISCNDNDDINSELFDTDYEILDNRDIADETFEIFRTIVGKPGVNFEQIMNYTAFELGLIHSIHFNKGCYTGQEIVSKTINTNSIRKKICLIRPLDANSEQFQLGDIIIDEEEDKIGEITSIPNVDTNKIPVTWKLMDEVIKEYKSASIAVLKNKLVVPGSTVNVKRAKGSNTILKGVIDLLPYSTFNPLLSSPSPPILSIKPNNQENIIKKRDNSDEEKRKLDKLDAMKKKIAEIELKKKNKL